MPCIGLQNPQEPGSGKLTLFYCSNCSKRVGNVVLTLNNSVCFDRYSMWFNRLANIGWGNAAKPLQKVINGVGDFIALLEQSTVDRKSNESHFLLIPCFRSLTPFFPWWFDPLIVGHEVYLDIISNCLVFRMKAAESIIDKYIRHGIYNKHLSSLPSTGSSYTVHISSVRGWSWIELCSPWSHCFFFID